MLGLFIRSKSSSRKGPLASHTTLCAYSHALLILTVGSYLWTDGPDAVQQWGQLDMGTLAAGPRVRAERQAQGGASGPTAVSSVQRHIHADVTARDLLSFTL